MKESEILFLTLVLSFYLTAANGQTSSSVGLDSCFKAKKALDAGVKAIGGEDALRLELMQSATRSFTADHAMR